jgi:hypothetical protein
VIWFAAVDFDDWPDRDIRELIAHELAHVFQFASGGNGVLVASAFSKLSSLLHRLLPCLLPFPGAVRGRRSIGLRAENGRRGQAVTERRGRRAQLRWRQSSSRPFEGEDIPKECPRDIADLSGGPAGSKPSP